MGALSDVVGGWLQFGYSLATIWLQFGYNLATIWLQLGDAVLIGVGDNLAGLRRAVWTVLGVWMAGVMLGGVGAAVGMRWRDFGAWNATNAQAQTLAGCVVAQGRLATSAERTAAE